MEIFVISRDRMEQLVGSEDFRTEDYNIISIIDPNAKWIFAEPTDQNVLQLRFNDLEGDRYDSEDGRATLKEQGWVLFSEAHAKEIIDFLNRVDTSKDLIVHCTAGISRSGAVGDFARVKFEIPFGKFIANNRQIQPNSWVRRILFRLEFPDFFER